MKNISRSKSYLIVAAFWLAICLLASTKTQAQQSWCDSLTTQHYPVTGISITLTSLPAGVDSVEVLWTACNTSTCYSAGGITGYFPLISLSDTVKLCYDVWLYNSNTVEICNHCDSIIHDGNSWILFNRGNTVGINELGFVIEEDGVRWYSDQMYDLRGREITTAPKGTMYIKNRKLYLKN
jgi:hypothetical protein